MKIKLMLLSLLLAAILLLPGCSYNEPNYTIVMDSNSNIIAVINDGNLNSLVVMDKPHAEIHLGDSYEWTDYADITLNNVMDLQIYTGANNMHLTGSISVEAETYWALYEGVTVATNGTSYTPPNNLRESSKTSTTTLRYITNTSVANANADTDVTGALRIAHGVVGAGRNAGTNSHDTERVLKPYTWYCIRFVANAAGNVNWQLQWYEEP